MSWVEGLAACAPLGKACVLDWSAIATASAAFVALFVGIAPLVWGKRQRARIGRAKARIAEVDLKMQALHLAAGLHLISGKVVQRHNYRVAMRQFRALNADSCRDLVPYLDSLSSGLEAPLSDVISDIGSAIRLLEDMDSRDDSMETNPSGPRSLYEELLETMESARKALSTAIGGGYVLEPLEPDAERLAETLRRYAMDELMAEVLRGQHVR